MPSQVRFLAPRTDVSDPYTLCVLLLTGLKRPEIFDEYTRRQYVAKRPDHNPFGTEEIPKKFADFDVFTKLRVLFQLSQWTLLNPDRLREKMPETRDTEQANWVSATWPFPMCKPDARTSA